MKKKPKQIKTNHDMFQGHKRGGATIRGNTVFCDQSGHANSDKSHQYNFILMEEKMQ